MNIYDISKICGVSIATVSRVLNNDSKVSAKTKQRVMSVIEENNYVPSRGTSKKVIKEIGILCTSLSRPGCSKIVEKLITELKKLGYDTLILCCGNDVSDKRHAMEHLVDRKISAVIIDGTDFLEYTPADNDYIRQAASYFPIILLNAFIEANNIYCSLCDEEHLLYTIADDLIKKGNDSLLFLFSSMSPYCLSMLEGFRHANFVNGIEPAPEYTHLCNGGYDSAAKYVDSLLKSGKKIDAILTTDDILASGAMQSAHLANLSIPNDIQICGNGNTIVSKTTYPQLTSINLRDEEICKSAINTIIGISRKADIASRVTIPAELIKRDSTL